MNEAADPVEAELRALAPATPGRELEERIAARLEARAWSRADRVLGALLGMAAAAACLSIALIGTDLAQNADTPAASMAAMHQRLPLMEQARALARLDREFEQR